MELRISMIRVFVYGTLRQGMYNYETYYKGHVVHRQMGYVKGELYTIKDKVYPALIPGSDWILGEIMDMDETFSLTAVDEMEGFYGEGNILNEYDKVICDIYDIDKKTILDRIPVYMYNQENPSHNHKIDKKIISGDYVTYIANK